MICRKLCMLITILENFDALASGPVYRQERGRDPPPDEGGRDRRTGSRGRDLLPLRERANALRRIDTAPKPAQCRSEEHTSELQSHA